MSKFYRAGEVINLSSVFRPDTIATYTVSARAIGSAYQVPVGNAISAYLVGCVLSRRLQLEVFLELSLSQIGEDQISRNEYKVVRPMSAVVMPCIADELYFTDTIFSELTTYFDRVTSPEVTEEARRIAHNGLFKDLVEVYSGRLLGDYLEAPQRYKSTKITHPIAIDEMYFHTDLIDKASKIKFGLTELSVADIVFMTINGTVDIDLLIKSVQNFQADLKTI